MQRSFQAGEIAPTLYGGADSKRYQSALSTCRNFIVQRHGGVTMRAGTQYVATVKDSSTETYLLKFVFNDADAFIIEAGTHYFRFHQKGAPVLVSGVSAWSAIVTYIPGQVVSSAGTNYIAIPSTLPNLNFLPPNATYWYPLSGSILELPTPWAAADIPLLKYVQANNVVTFTHPDYAPRQLQRSSGNWSLTTFSTSPWTSAPVGVVATPGAVGTLNPKYVVTAAKSTTYEETVASAPATCALSATPTAANPNVITWTPVTVPSSPAEYNLFVDTDGNGMYGYIGTTPNTTFNDVGFTPDFSVTPPVARTLFNATGDYPGTSAYYQQRQLFAGSANNPDQVDASRTGAFANFTISSPIQDDDALRFALSGRQINEARHMIETSGALVILTRTGEWIVAGDSDGVLRPTAINAHQQSYSGAAHVVPVIIGSSILYVQARGNIVRDFRLTKAPQTGISTYDGRDLTLYAQHLFQTTSITRLDLQQLPDSILWAIRSDGTLLGLTYIPEQEVWGWHRHDSPNGVFEDVCVIPETMPAVPIPGSGFPPLAEDSVYVIVRRTINGATQRSIERFASRNWFDYRLDAIYLDCELGYNGINASATTVTLTTAAGWTTSDLITVTASAPTFDASWVGEGVTIWDASSPANVNRIRVTQYIDPTHVKGNPVATVQTALRTTAVTTWSRAVANVAGLTPLIGQAVTILANGIVFTGTVSPVGSLNNIDGAAGLYDVIHVGLTPTFEIETLDLDSDAGDVRDRQKLIQSVSMLIQNSRLGFQAGPDDQHLLTYAAQAGVVLSTDVFQTALPTVTTSIIEMNISATWAKPGRVHIRQTNPLPLTILGLLYNGPVGG